MLLLALFLLFLNLVYHQITANHPIFINGAATKISGPKGRSRQGGSSGKVNKNKNNMIDSRCSCLRLEIQYL
mgnify:CR=1 FL=1